MTGSSNPELLGVVREEYGRIAYSFKAHQKMIDRLNSAVLWQKRLNAALLTLTAGGTIDVLIRDQTESKIIALVLSALALFLAIYQLSTNPDRLVDQHRVAARALWIIREEYLHLIADVKAGMISIEAARTKRDDLTHRAARVYESSPDTDARSYSDAQKALKENEELTFTDREIDLMLPRALRETSH